MGKKNENKMGSCDRNKYRISILCYTNCDMSCVYFFHFKLKLSYKKIIKNTYVQNMR